MTVNYQRRLQRYFDRHYGMYDESVEWYPDIADNVWKFDIPELRKRVTLTCGADGKVDEREWPFDKPEMNPYFENKD